MRPPFRIAILECDTPLDNTKAKYEGYGGVFRRLLKESAVALGGINPDTDLIISKYDIVNGTEYPNLDEIDAILLTGSSVWSYPLLPEALLTQLISKNTTLSPTNRGSLPLSSSHKRRTPMTGYG
jgi:hypothetical protein